MENFSLEKMMNSVTTFFDVDTSGLHFVSLKWLYEHYKDGVFLIKGIFINRKGNYGDTPVIISESALVNLPNHLMPTAEKILHTDAAIQQIKEGLAGFKVYEFESKNQKAKGKKYYSIRYVDLVAGEPITIINVP